MGKVWGTPPRHGHGVLKQFTAGEGRVVVLEDGMARPRWEL